MTFILLAFTLYAFAFVAYTHFRNQVSDEDNENTELHCHSLLACFLLIFDIGLRISEGPGSLLERKNLGVYGLMYRFGYDILFVVIISIFLLNVVFGIIIDTFGSLRTEQHDKEVALESNCFVCGLPRSDFDAKSMLYKQKQDKLHRRTKNSKRLGKNFVSGFKFHISKEHNLMHYLGYILYLENKDRTECNGLETYVLQQIEASREEFFPIGYALAVASKSQKS